MDHRRHPRHARTATRGLRTPPRREVRMRNDYQKELEHLHDQVRQLSKDPAYKVPEVPPGSGE